MMTNTVYDQAKTWAEEGMFNANYAAKIRSFRNTLLDASLTKGGLDSVRAATKNGISMSKDTPLSVPDTLKALRVAIRWIDAGIIPCQSRAFGRF
jgi:hypothetical protein